MGFTLTAIGTLLLLLSLVGIAFGVYMATDPRTRESGQLFAVWWIPGAAAATGVFMRDAVTFAVGLFCFLVAGAVFTYEGGNMRKPAVKRTRKGSEKASREDRAAS